MPATSPSANASRRGWLTRVRSLSDLDALYSPAHWGYVAGDPGGAYRAECPTVREVAETFGADTARLWVYGQMTALYGASSNRDCGVADGLNVFAQAFSREAGGYKLTELMLFFARYKAGRYDASYASFDARRIGSAFFREFLPDRTRELERIRRADMRAEAERRRFVPPEGYSSLSWYRELKRRAEAGDGEARKELLPP